MGKWWHTLATIGMIALGAFTPYIQAAIGDGSKCPKIPHAPPRITEISGCAALPVKQ